MSDHYFKLCQVTRRVNAVDYEVERPGRRQEKKWHPSSSSKVFIAIAADNELDLKELEMEYVFETALNKSWEALSHLTTATQIEQLLQEFSNVLGVQLGRTTVTLLM